MGMPYTRAGLGNRKKIQSVEMCGKCMSGVTHKAPHWLVAHPHYHSLYECVPGVISPVTHYDLGGFASKCRTYYFAVVVFYGHFG